MIVKTLLLATTSLLCASMACAQDTPPADKETTVVVTKKPVTKKLDKTVYSTAANPQAESGTAQDVLQATPTVSVTAAGDISVQGNRNVTVLINGKPSAAMSGDNRAIALQTMAGSDIASVEVITNPSAAYNAQGGAIINIVLKKDRKPGLHGTVRGTASDMGLWTLNASGDYTRGKLSLHGSLGVRRDGTLKYRRSDVSWHDPLSGLTGETITSSKVFIRRWVYSASLGLDYDLSETDTLNAQATYNFRRSKPWFDELHEDSFEDTPTDAYHRISYGPNQQADDSESLSYSHQTDDVLFKLNAQHSGTDTLVDKSAGSFYLYPEQPDSHDRIANRLVRKLDQAGLDYARQMGENAQLSFGLDYRKDTNDIDNYFAALDPLTGAETVDTNTTHRYLVTATQGAVYVTGQVDIGQWEALLGLRYEDMTTRIDGENLATRPDTRTRSLNPSLHLKYAFSARKSLTVSYRQSLQRPDPRDLNPYVTYIDAQNLETGNPDLMPQDVKALEVTYNADGDNLSQSVGLFYRVSSDTVVDRRTFTTDNILLATKANGGRGVSGGFSGSLEWTPSQAWRLSADGSFYGVELETTDFGRPVRQTGVSYDANLTVSYVAGANDLALDAHIQGPGIMPQGRYSGGSALNLTWKRKLTSRLTLTVSASDILDGSKSIYRTSTSTFDQRGYDHFVAQRAYVGFVWKIG